MQSPDISHSSKGLLLAISLSLLAGLNLPIAAKPIGNPKAVNTKQLPSSKAPASGNQGEGQYADADDETLHSTAPSPPSLEYISLDQLENNLEEAKSSNELMLVNIMFSMPEFVEKLESPQSAAKAWELVKKLQVVVTASNQNTDKAFAQALIARFDKVTGRVAQAEKDYKTSLATPQDSTQGFSLELVLRSFYNNLMYDRLKARCNIALALLYCQTKKLSEAEQIYDELMKGFYKQSWLPFLNDNKGVYISKLDGYDGNEIIALAGALGNGYAQAGQTDKAKEKFTDLLAFIQSKKIEENPQSNTFWRATGALFDWNSIKGPLVGTFDPIIGPDGSLEEGLSQFIKFSAKHPGLFPERECKKVSSMLDRLTQERIEKAKADRKSRWQFYESSAIDQLGSNPQEALKALRYEVKQKRAELRPDTEDDFTISLSLIGGQLVQAGFYQDAEPLLIEAIGINKNAGRNSLLPLAHDYCNLGLLYLKQGKLKEAGKQLDNAIKTDTNDTSNPNLSAKIKTVYARFLMETKNFAGAEQSLREATTESKATTATALQATPSPDLNFNSASIRAGTFYTLGTLYTKEGKFEQAKQALEQALNQTDMYQNNPLAPLTYAKLGEVASKTGSFDIARKHLLKADSSAEKASASRPDYSEIYLSWAQYYKSVNNKAEAGKYYKKAADLLEEMLGPKNPRVIELRKLAASP